MFSWNPTNRIAAAGVAACLLFGGIEVMELLAGGGGPTDLNTPAGLLAQRVAMLFTDAPSLTRAGTDRRELTYHLIVGWHVALGVLYAALLWSRPRLARRPRLGAVVLMLQMLAGALSNSALLYVLAAELGASQPLRRGLAWLALQIALLASVFVYMATMRRAELGDDAVRQIFMYASLTLLFQALAFGVAQVALRERQARLALAAANARLRATQSMLGDTVRAMERIRIARDLHDAVGHHLTALNLHLDLALRQADASAPAALHTSRDLARSLLAEVRVVVSSERQEQRIDLRAAIATMCAGMPAPRIAFGFDAQLGIASPVLANTLFFCVQEALTNAARHARAELLTIDIQRCGDDIVLAVQDDGRGSGGAPEGNGLRGMRERVAELGGTLHWTPSPPGFGFAITLPLAGSGA